MIKIMIIFFILRCEVSIVMIRKDGRVDLKRICHNNNNFLDFIFQMSSHSYRRATQGSENKSRFSTNDQTQPQNPMGSLMRDNRNYQEQVNHNLHYRLTYDTVEYSSQTKFEELSRVKDVLLDLIDQFQKGSRRVIIDGEKKDSYERRLQLLEHELDGLMKQKIMFQAPDREGGTRKLDYALLLNEKQNQIVELEKKIQNLEQRLRRASQRQIQLQNEVVFLNSKIRTKNSIIESKENQISQETAYSKSVNDLLSKVKQKVNSNRQLSTIIKQTIEQSSFERSEIRITSSSIVRDSRRSDYSQNEITKLMRELQRLRQKGSRMQELEQVVQSWILGLRQSSLKSRILQGEQRIRNEERVKEVNSKLQYASQIYKKQVQKMRKSNPGMDIEYDQNILNTLRDSSSRVSVNSTGIIQIQRSITKTVQVPVQDARTKTLIYQLATEMKKLYTKYPKLYKEIDPRLAEFFSQELIDLVSVDEVDRLVQIVKYQPQVVRVQNVYAYSSEKSRKVQFHLRVLLKALLTQMQNIVKKTGQVPEIDEGVIGLIREQIMDSVDVDDILKVYRTVPKIVQVEKVVQKIVQKIVQVPRLISVQNRVQVPVEVRKVDVVENVRNVPIQVPKVQTVYVQKLVQVPKVIQKIIQVPKVVENVVQVIRQVPKIVEVQKIVQKIVQVEKIKQVKEQIIVKVPQIQQVIVQRDRIVETQKIIQILKPIEVIVEKVQQVIRQVPKIVQVEKLRQIVVEKPVYYPAPSIQHEIIVKQVPVDRIIEKIVPVIKVQDRIVEIPKIIQKIVQVRDIIKQPYEVQVIKEKAVIQQSVKAVETIIEKPVVQRHEVEKVVEKYIQIPIVHEVIKIQKQYIKQPFIETVQKIIHKQVQIEKPVVLYQDRIVEVEKVINNFIVEPKIMNIVEERIVPLEKVIKEPVAVPTVVEKIVQKLVQVPKVVEVEKIVERIVPVPRVVQKVVEVQKVIEKIVNKIVYEESIKEIQRLVQIPVIQEKVLQIEVPRNVYVETQTPVEVRHEIMVRDEINTENVKIIEVQQPPRVVVQTKEVPREIIVQKIIPLSVPETHLVYLDKQIVVPVQIQIPVEIQREKFVPIQHIRQQIVEVDREREKIVPVTVEPDPRIIEIERIEQKPIIQEKVKVVVEQKPYFETVIQEVKTFEQKIVPPVTVEVQKVLRITEMCERVVERVVEMPKVYEIQKQVQKIVQKPKIIEVQKIVPHIINVNSYIQTIAQKIIDIPVLLERLKQIDRVQERLVPVTNTNTQIQVVQRNIERAVIEEKLKEAVDRVHVTQQILKVVDKVIVKDSDPVIITQDKIMEVPFIVQKIVQKIVVMPQIVEVLKYVHEVTEQQTLGAAVPQNIGEEEIEYKNLASNLRTELNRLSSQLRSLSSSQPALKSQISIIQKYLSQFQKYVLYPRIHQIIHQKEVEKVVEKQKVVKVEGDRNEKSLRMELSKSILIQKLILEMKRIKEENPNMRFELDEDIKLIFGPELRTRSNLVENDINRLIEQYANSVQSKFQSMGGWTKDHQLMLNTFLEERFLMANILRTANSDLNKAKAISEKRLQAMRKYKYERDQMEKAFSMLNSFFPSVVQSGKRSRYLDGETARKADEWMSSFTSTFVGSTIRGGEPTRLLGKLEESRCNSLLREKEEEIIRLKEEMRRMMTGRYESETKTVYKEVVKEADHTHCNLRIRQLQNRIRQLQRNASSSSRVRSDCSVYIQKIRTLQIEIEKLRIIEREHRNCGNSISRLNQQVSTLDKRLRESRTVGSQSQSERRQSQTSSSSYGVNYMEYTNLDQFGNRGVGQVSENDQGYHSGTFSRVQGSDQNREKRGYSNPTQQKAKTGGTQVFKETYEKKQYSSSGGEGGEYKGLGTSSKKSNVRQGRYISEQKQSKVKKSGSRETAQKPQQRKKKFQRYK